MHDHGRARRFGLSACLAFAAMLVGLSVGAAQPVEGTQQQYRVVGTGPGTARLELHEAPIAQPGPNEVLVRVHAAALNHRDLSLPGANPEGRVPLSDGAGEVVAVGAQVSRFSVGDRVAGTFFQDWVEGRPGAQTPGSVLGTAVDGMLSQYVVLDEQGLVSIPDYMSYEEAATLPCAAVTAWNALVTRGAVKPGDRVLLLGTGGVSIFGLQLAVALGAEPIITSSSDEKLERARELGAVHTINYRSTPEWQDVVREVTGGEGVHHVLEVGGRGTLERSLASLAPGGHMAVIGALAGGGAEIPAGQVMVGNLTVSGMFVGSRADFEAMNAFLEEHELRPVIDRVFPFEQAQQAYDHLDSGDHVGKVVIRVASQE